MTSRYVELCDQQFNMIGNFRCHHFTVLIRLIRLIGLLELWFRVGIRTTEHACTRWVVGATTASGSAVERNRATSGTLMVPGRSEWCPAASVQARRSEKSGRVRSTLAKLAGDTFLQECFFAGTATAPTRDGCDL